MLNRIKQKLLHLSNYCNTLSTHTNIVGTFTLKFDYN